MNTCKYKMHNIIMNYVKITVNPPTLSSPNESVVRTTLWYTKW